MRQLNTNSTLLPRQAYGPVIFGHRGCPREAPENTLLSMELAARQGAALETDLRGSRDGDVFLMHDPTLDRTTDGGGEIWKKTTSELRALDAGYGFRAADGSFPFRGRNIKIPTLGELLRAHPGSLINLDINQSQPSIVAAVVKDLDDTHSLRQAHGGGIVLTSQHRSTMREIEASRAPCALGLCRADVLEFLARVALGRLFERIGISGGWPLAARFRGRALQVPVVVESELSALFPAGLRPPASWLEAAMGWLLGPGHSEAGAVVTEAVVRAAGAANMPIHVWEIDDPSVAEGCFRTGVAGIFSNVPKRVAAALPGVSQEGGEEDR